jgi:hypothetical protein
VTDPKRLIDPESRSSSAIRALVRAARSDLPSEGRVEVIGARLTPWLGAASGGPSHGGPAPGIAVSGAAAGVKMATGVKAVAVAMMTLGVAAGGYAEIHSNRTVRPPAAPATAALPAPALPASAVAPGLAASAPPDPAEQGLAPLPPVSPAPSVRSRAASPALDGSDSEVALLQSAQDALSSNPPAALSFAARHAARFPQGALAQEREVIAIEALLGLGRRDEARARAARFYRAFPRSAYRPRIEGLLGDDSSHNP